MVIVPLLPTDKYPLTINNQPMKSINFRRGSTFLRTQKEKPLSPKKTNIDRYIYFAILGVLCIFIAGYLWIKFFYIRANGQVLLDNVMIRLTEDGRIIKLFKAEGDSVTAGDSLFMYFVEARANQLLGISDSSSTNIEKNNSSGMQWVEREIFNIQTKIALNKVEIEENSKLLSKQKSDLLRVQNQVMLDALPHSRLESVQQDVDHLSTEIAKTKQENTELELLAAQLKNPLDAAPSVLQSNSGFSTTGIYGLTRVFIAPVDGYVNRIYKSEYETALRTEDILSVQKRDRIFIKAFFEQKDIDHFKENDVVNVRFPDGTKSKGIIKRLYLGTYDLPVEFQKKYEPTHRTIAADVYPLDSAEAGQWKPFHKLNAEITKFKF